MIHQGGVWLAAVQGKERMRTERDEEDSINQDGRRLKRREARLVSLGEGESRCDAQ